MNTVETGRSGEQVAADFLEEHGYEILDRNFTYKKVGEIDIVARYDGMLVFVEVRARARARHGGAGASVTALKQRRLVWAARHYLLRWASPPPCRFDVVALEGGVLHWWPGAFQAAD